MGASKSKEGKVLSEPGKGGAAAPIQPKGVVIPEDGVPYSGFLVQYHMINVQVFILHSSVTYLTHLVSVVCTSAMLGISTMK